MKKYEIFDIVIWRGSSNPEDHHIGIVHSVSEKEVHVFWDDELFTSWQKSKISHKFVDLIKIKCL